MENNLADAIAALARNVRHQGDGPCSKVREPDPFNGTDPAKLQTSLVQIQLSFNDCPRAFANDRHKINFTISYLKGIALAHFKNFLIEPDLLNSPVWEDDYGEFISELKTYFNSPDIVGEAESKLENLSMKPNQCIAKYLVEFNRLATITEWHNCALRHQFYHGLPAHIKDEVSWVGNPSHSPNSEPWLNQLMVAIGTRRRDSSRTWWSVFGEEDRQAAESTFLVESRQPE